MTSLSHEPLRQFLIGLAAILLLFAAAELALAGRRAYEAGRAWGDHPATTSWVWGIVLLVISLLALFLSTQRFYEADPAVRVAGYFMALLTLAGGSMLLSRGFLILRDAGYLWHKRRANVGLPDGVPMSDVLAERTAQLGEANVLIVSLQERLRQYERAY